MRRLYITLTLLFLTTSACVPPAVSSPNTPARPPVTPTAVQTSARLDITYCVMDGVEIQMDMYSPMSSTKMPAVIFVHGGGWTKDDKSSVIGVSELARAGIVTFSINHRLGNEYKFPAMIEDVKCAIRSIRAHAKEYNIDPNRIGAYGGSSGGHLVALIGVADKSAGFDVGEYLQYSSRVQAVADIYGPADLVKQYSLFTVPSMGAAFLESDLARASPINYVTPDDPPFLIVHGTKDNIVPFEQSQTLYELLLFNNVPTRFIVVKNGLHGFNIGNAKPSLAEILQIVADFFAETLK